MTRYDKMNLSELKIEYNKTDDIQKRLFLKKILDEKVRSSLIKKTDDELESDLSLSSSSSSSLSSPKKNPVKKKDK